MIEIVGVLMTAGNGEHARAQNMDDTLCHQQRIARIGNQTCQAMGKCAARQQPEASDRHPRGPLSPEMIARIVERAGEAAEFGIHVHTRLIWDFLGHASIANTVRYMKLAPGRLAAARVR